MNDNNIHLDEDAELYALGMLDDAQRARIESHLRDCEPCLQRVGRAEATVAAMTESLGGMRSSLEPAAVRRLAPVTVLRTWGAMAAALIFAMSSAVLGTQNASLQDTMHGQRVVLRAMVRSHFAHAQFASTAGAPVEAKVVYERHGRWFSVLAVDPQPGTEVAFLRKDGTRMVPLQPLVVHDGVASVMMRLNGEVAKLQLLDARGDVVASVRPLVAAPDAASLGSGAVALNR